MGNWSVWSVCLLLSVLPVEVLSQDGFDLSDALDDDSKAPTPTPKPGVPADGAGADDIFKNDGTTTTKVPPKVVPKNPVKPKPKPDERQTQLLPTMHPDLLPSTKLAPRGLPAGDDFDLADALDPNNDIGSKDRNKGQGGGFSDSDLADIGKDNTYKPDKGKGGRPGSGSGHLDQSDDSNGTMAETGTIAGIVSAVAMALVGAVSSYISYQKKKLCFSIQQSLNADMVKAENPEAVVATEPQVQQTLLEPPSAEPPSEEKENAV